MNSDIMKEFEALCEKIKIRERTTYGSNEIEDLLLEMLNFIKGNASYKEIFLKCFLDKVFGSKESDLISEEYAYLILIIQFCMRELQWLEIKYAAIAKKSQSDNWRLVGIMDDILEVYEKDWPDEDLYEYYSTKR